MEDLYEPDSPAKSSPDNDIAKQSDKLQIQQENTENFLLENQSNNFSSGGLLQTSVDSLESDLNQKENYVDEPSPSQNKRWKAFMVGSIFAVSVIFLLAVYLLDIIAERVTTISVMIISIITSVFGIVVSLFGGSFFKYLMSVAIFLVGAAVLFLGIFQMTEYSVQNMYESFKSDPEVFMQKYNCQCWNDIETPNDCINISRTSCEEVVATNGLIGFILSALGFCAMICASVFLTIGHHLLAYERKKRKLNQENYKINTSPEGYKRYIDIMEPPSISVNDGTDSAHDGA